MSSAHRRYDTIRFAGEIESWFAPALDAREHPERPRPRDDHNTAAHFKRHRVFNIHGRMHGTAIRPERDDGIAITGILTDVRDQPLLALGRATPRTSTTDSRCDHASSYSYVQLLKAGRPIRQRQGKFILLRIIFCCKVAEAARHIFRAPKLLLRAEKYDLRPFPQLACLCRTDMFGDLQCQKAVLLVAHDADQTVNRGQADRADTPQLHEMGGWAGIKQRRSG